MELDEIIQKLEQCNCVNHEEIVYLQDLIERDGLTSIKNRRAFDRDIQEEIARAENAGYDITLVFVDIDDFKKYNDSEGHLEGDNALKQVAQVLNSSTHTFDHTYRYGGEEFAVLLPNTNLNQGYLVADRLREKVKKETGLTISVGISNYKNTAENLKHFIEYADTALYGAKSNGKDQCLIYEKAGNKELCLW